MERAATAREIDTSRTYRVQGIPQHHGWKSAKAFLEDCLGFETGSSDIKLHSLAHSAVYKEEKTATITSTDILPKLVGEKEEWTFDFPDNTDDDEQPNTRVVAIDTHFEGFTALNSFENDDDHLLDCIAIPGLGGHPFGSFKQRRANHMWLRDDLPRDLRGARALIYGYNTKIADSKSFQDLEALASTFRRALVSVRRHQIKPLIFVAHSLGGLVLKAAIIQMSNDTHTNAAATLRATCGMMLFGCPNQGMDVESLIPMCNGRANLSFLSSLSSKQSFGPLRRLCQDFSKAFEFHCSRIISFYETQLSCTAIKDSDGHWTMSGPLTVLVDEFSATHNRPGDNEAHNVQAINRDHSHMVKFSPKDVNYIIVLGFLKELSASAYDPISVREQDTFSVTSINATSTFPGHNTIVQQERWLDKLSNATQAAFNSSERQHDPTCLHNTRIDVLKEIRGWADGQDERRIYWLNGLAGTGKSTIARTVAREYFDHKRLGASFFFSKGGGDVGHAKKFFTTIALQLATRSPLLNGYICDAISENKDIDTQSLRDQWHQLILQPLSKLDQSSSTPSTYILVVDALDECEGENDIRAILQLLAKSPSLKRVHLRAFLTSRPETLIRHSFHQIPDAEQQNFVLHNISPSIVDQDIHIFLQHSFKYMSQERSLDAFWPGDQIIQRLIQKANGLFIWAATAYRFIYEGKQFAAERLDMILENNTDSTAPEKHLNEIYVTVLNQSIKPNFEDKEKQALSWMIRQILGSIVVLFSPLSVDSFCRLLHIRKKDIDQTLEDLHAILNISKDQTQPLRLHHPSFRDFLTNKERCKDPNFLVDEKKMHQKMADNSIRLMAQTLKQDIFGLDTYGAPATGIESAQVQKCLPQEVQYACLYWIQHLQKSEARLNDDDQVHKFLQVHVLHWLEALSWMRKVSEGIHAIISLESIALTSGCPTLYAFIHDIKRFALHGRAAIDQAPLQVYCGALIFAPMNSMVRKQFANRIPGWIKKLPKVRKEWTAVLQTLDDHSGNLVKALAFSPDGKVLASASNYETVTLWDAATGAVLQTLDGHLDSVEAVTFSLDGKMLASASVDTVKLWDAGTGAVLQTLVGHLDFVKAVAFSPDGKMLASASEDGMVKLWDVSTGVALQTVEIHSYLGASNFSPDGKVLASESSDDTVKLWDTGTGAVLQTLEGHSYQVNFVVFSPDGKILASASGDAMIKLWDTGTGAALQTLEVDSIRLNAVAFSSDSKMLASAWSRIELWEISTGAVLQTLEGGAEYAYALAFSPDGKVLASASGIGIIKLWDVNMKAVLQTHDIYLTMIHALTFSLDGKVLASGSGDGTVKLWDASTNRVLQTLEGHLGIVTTITFSPNDKVLVTSSFDQTMKLWDTGTGGLLRTLKCPRESVYAVAFSPDGKVLASGSDIIGLWDISTGAALQIFDENHSNPIQAVAFSPDGKMLASLFTDGAVKLWDTDTGVALQAFNGDRNSRGPVAFSLDGKVLALGLHIITLWDTSTGAALQTLKGHSNEITAAAFSSDGTKLASTSIDATVRLWDTDTGAALQTIEVDTPHVDTLSFTDDGTFLKTDKGLLSITSLSPSDVFSQRNLAREIFIRRCWITQGRQNMIWFPENEFYPAVHGGVVALGHHSGCVSFLELAFEGHSPE